MDTETERTARLFLKLVSNHYDLAGALLFGSRARHDGDSDSDADIAVLLRGVPGRVFNLPGFWPVPLTQFSSVSVESYLSLKT
ncbi:nucleotidyltransferase domain-containing protein [uncultured Thiodictyon sp.]|jgi:predicted nucleotidyltransferase|uniref:nucleotidyltransferase domain-containing protein n=1 Tax=uncultured Thiodictyon sp. TaxID=1846217 RepID=UPI0025FC64A3|nr:nucleotidyltransferase domain-containing protein [uncultured Thiodictyon sp.]